MLKRLSIVAFNTGLSQLIALVAVGFATRSFDAKTIGQIGVIESSIILTTSIISFGLQLATNRNIVLNQNWMRYFEEGQKARITMSVMLFPIGLIYFLTGDLTYLLFFGSPVIALNGDYALYGRGLSEYASKVSFIRVLIPSIVLIFCSVIGTDSSVIAYSFGLFVGIYISGFLTSSKLKTPYLFSPKISSLNYYVDSTRIGIAAVSSTMMSSGVIFVSNYFYEIDKVGEAYLGIKLFMIYKGVRRIVIQTFFDKLNDPVEALKVDRINILIGVITSSAFIFFPRIVCNLFYGECSLELCELIVFIGFATLFSSMTSVADTKMLLKKMDQGYFITFFTSMIITMFVVIGISKTQYGSMGILWGIFTGEVAILFMFAAYLGLKDYFIKRFKILFINLLTFFIPIFYNYFNNKTIVSLLICITLMGATMLWASRNYLFNSPALIFPWHKLRAALKIKS
jgi:hypothetical protein